MDSQAQQTVVRTAPKSARPARARRRWWQRLLRWGFVLVVLTVAAYATLPWWLPTDALRKYIAEDLSRKTGVPVTIDRIACSWKNGLEIHGLTIASPPAVASEPLVQVEHIQADFSPLTYLFQEKLAWMEVRRPHLFICFDRDGRSNLEAISKMPQDVTPELLAVHQAVLSLRVPEEKRVLRLEVANLQVQGGKLQRLSGMTMTAALQQPSGGAPLELQVQASGAGSAANAVFSFSNVRLDDLPLIRLLNWPLDHLKGKAAGRLDLQVKPNAAVDRLALGLTLRDLDVKTNEGLHVWFDQADLGLQVRMDPLTAHVAVESLRVAMPGLELVGGASFAADPTGLLMSIGSVHMEGVIEPSKWLPMLAASKVVAPELAMDGPVKVKFSADRDRAGKNASALRLKLSAEATKLRMVHASRELKPASRPLEWQFDGEIDWRNWDLVIERSCLTLGANEFTGKGRIFDLVKRATAWDSGRIVADLTGNLEYSSEWKLRDLDSLRQAAPMLQDVLGPLSAQGEISGRMSVKPGLRPEVSMSFTVEPRAKLRFGPLVKPKDVAMSLVFRGKVDPVGLGIEDGDLDLTVGQGLVDVDHLNVRSERPPTSAAASGPSRETLVVDCDWSVEQAQAVLDALPTLRERPALTGSMRCRKMRVRLDERLLAAEIDLDALPLGARVEGMVDKPAGLQTDLKADVTLDLTSPLWAERKMDANFAVQSAIGSVRGRIKGNLGDPMRAPVEFSAAMAVSDAARLAEVVPPLSRMFTARGLSGKADATLAILGKGDGEFSASSAFHGRGLAFAMPGGPCKAQGVPLDGQFAATVRLGIAGTDVHVRQADLAIDRSRVTFVGGLDLSLPKAALPAPVLPAALGPLRAIDGNLEMRTAFEGPLLAICPPLKDLANRYGITGRAELSAMLKTRPAAEGKSSQIRLSGTLRADELGLARIGPACKPAGMKLAVELESAFAMDLTQAKVDKFAFALGGLEVAADVALTRAGDRVDVREAHVVLGSKDAAQFTEVLPALKEFNLSGAFRGEVELRESGKSIPRLGFSAEKLSGQWGGKKLLLDGGLRVGGLEDPAGPGVKVQSFTTDGLEVRIGQNHFWLLTEMENLTTHPSGSVQLLAEYMDDMDLAAFFGAVASGQAPAAATTAPSGAAKEPQRLTIDQQIDLEKQGDRLLELFRKHQPDGRGLKITAEVARLRTFDANVRQTYNVNCLTLDLTVQRGGVNFDYRVGVNGGLIQFHSSTNLSDPAPKFDCQVTTTDVQARPEIQPQLAMFFPGNIVGGKFNRQERTSVPLREYLANQIDARYQLHPVGTALTVTTDGYVEGRSAPRFITRIFPGLNLTRYKYNQMTGFATYKADGSADNDMIFDGKDYDVYIEGVTDRANWGEYEIGLILTPGSAEAHHTWKQGRIPVLKFKGLIVGGKILNQEVSYPMPNETLYRVFLQNNIFYRMWVNRKR